MRGPLGPEGALKVEGVRFPDNTLADRKESKYMTDKKKSAKELAAELAAALESEGSADLATVAARRNYWRQRTGEARELVRKMSKEIDSALSTLNALKAEIAAQRKHWIGPKVPPKNPQGFSRG